MHALKKEGFLIATFSFFIITLLIHYFTALPAYEQQQREHNMPFVWSEFNNEFIRQMMENWQSEMIQLLWQVGGLSILYAVGSSQDKGSSAKDEKLLEEILRRVSPSDAEDVIRELNQKYR